MSVAKFISSPNYRVLPALDGFFDWGARHHNNNNNNTYEDLTSKIGINKGLIWCALIFTWFWRLIVANALSSEIPSDVFSQRSETHLRCFCGIYIATHSRICKIRETHNGTKKRQLIGSSTSSPKIYIDHLNAADVLRLLQPLKRRFQFRQLFPNRFSRHRWPDHQCWSRQITLFRLHRLFLPANDWRLFVNHLCSHPVQHTDVLNKIRTFFTHIVSSSKYLCRFSMQT